MIDTHVSKVVISGKEGGKWAQGEVHRSFNWKFFFNFPFSCDLLIVRHFETRDSDWGKYSRIVCFSFLSSRYFLACSVWFLKGRRVNWKGLRLKLGGLRVYSGKNSAEKKTFKYFSYFITVLLSTLSLRLNVCIYIIVYSEILTFVVGNFSVIIPESYWEAKFLHSRFTFGPKTGLRET